MLNDEELESSVSSLVEASIATPVVKVASFDRPCAIAACVRIVGAWNGAMILSACSAFRQRVATSLLEAPLETLSAADETEAFAEFTNVIAGNVKAILDVEGRITAPVVSLSGPLLFPSSVESFACVLSDLEGGVLELRLHDDAAADTSPDGQC